MTTALSLQFESTVLPHREGLTRAALALTRDAAEAQDLVQETLLRAYTRFSQLREPGAVGGWLRKILRSVFLNRRESKLCRAAHEERLQETWAEAAIVPGVESEVLTRVEADAVLAALARLPEVSRQLLWLAHVEERDYRDISARTGLTPEVIKSRLYRARQQVRATLAA